MENEQVIRACPRGECSWAKAVEAAKSLGLYEELLSGAYSCCQVSQWYEEQWQAWLEAGMEAKPWYMTDAEEPQSQPVPVYVRRRKDNNRRL